MGYDRKYIVWAFGYIVIGMILGIFMAATHNHSQFVTHAHINLAGFLLSFVYGMVHKLWLGQANSTMAKMQFIIHQTAVVMMTTGLFLLYGKFVPEDQVEPVLKVSTVSVLIGVILMIYMFVKSSSKKQ